MWLLGRLAPDFKTIADFRKDNGATFQATCRAFVQFCRQVGLIGGQLVVIDGSKFQAVASQRKHLSLAKLKRQQAKLEAEIARYLAELDEADRSEATEVIDRGAVKAALQHLKSRHAHEAVFARMQAQPEVMVRRRSIVEHPFGNLKQWILGSGRFLLCHSCRARARKWPWR